MALIYQKQVNDQSMLAIWKITETLSELETSFVADSSELEQLNAIKNQKRKLQWICSRLLLANLLKKEKVTVNYDEFGKPFIPDSQYKISISHAGDYVSVIINEGKDCGIDIEMIHSKIKKIASKFVGPSEKVYMDPAFENEHLHVIWGVKEALFKIYGKGELDFKNELKVNQFVYDNQRKVSASIFKAGVKKNYTAHYEKFNGHMLVYI
jgi:4'-phosphopantetheinyl transferase